jgi:hypothetical protein
MQKPFARVPYVVELSDPDRALTLGGEATVLETV